MYRKCVHGCDGNKPEDMRTERRAKRAVKKIALAAFSIALCSCSEVIHDPAAVAGSCSTTWYQTQGTVRQVTCGAGKIMEMTPGGITCRCPPPCPGGDCKP